MNLVAVDIGGTHTRFAMAHVAARGVVTLGDTVMLRTGDYPDFAAAWAAYATMVGGPLPGAVAIAAAGPVTGDHVQLTNSNWIISTTTGPGTIGPRLVLNDFAAVGHGVAQMRAHDLIHLCGPDDPLPRHGIVSIVGPGTGLGVGQVVMVDGADHSFASEGGHVDFAPLDAVDDAILAAVRARHGRASVERIVSGPGLATIVAVLAERAGQCVPARSDADLWRAALSGSDALAAAALDRFCMILGSVAGDCALQHGPTAVVIAGGIGFRLATLLPNTRFAERFVAKGRFTAQMQAVPVKLIAHPQPGLFGAAAAFARKFT